MCVVHVVLLVSIVVVALAYAVVIWPVQSICILGIASLSMYIVICGMILCVIVVIVHDIFVTITWHCGTHNHTCPGTPKLKIVKRAGLLCMCLLPLDVRISLDPPKLPMLRNLYWAMPLIDSPPVQATGRSDKPSAELKTISLPRQCLSWYYHHYSHWYCHPTPIS